MDLAYVIFIDFLALGVLGFCFLLLSNVQFLVLVNLPPGLATRVDYRYVVVLGLDVSDHVCDVVREECREL